MPVAKNLDEVATGIHQKLKLLIEKDGVMTGRYLVCLPILTYHKTFHYIHHYGVH